MAQRHSTPVRGLLSVKNSPLFQGRFGRLFRSLPPATFGSNEQENLQNLSALGTAMTAGFDPPTDGKDPEESGIPGLYTYLGQFVDHDITFDPASSLQAQDGTYFLRLTMIAAQEMKKSSTCLATSWRGPPTR